MNLWKFYSADLPARAVVALAPSANEALAIVRSMAAIENFDPRWLERVHPYPVDHVPVLLWCCSPAVMRMGGSFRAGSSLWRFHIPRGVFRQHPKDPAFSADDLLVLARGVDEAVARANVRAFCEAHGLPVMAAECVPEPMPLDPERACVLAWVES